MTKTPDEIVAERIVAALKEEKLIPEQKLKGLAEKLVAGSLKADDWRLLQGVLNEIAGMGWIRNQVGCHFNTAGMSVSDPEVLKLGEKTIELTEAIVCDNCGELPSSNKSGSYWNCSCKRARLYPLTH